MIVKKLNQSQFLLRIEPNEELFGSLLNFAQKHKINSGFFYGIGASKECLIGRYSEKKKDYDWFEVKRQMEIASLVGNLTLKENHLYLHIHSTLGDKNLKTISGHLKKLIVFPTCEIVFFSFKTKIQRKFDKLTGLFLID
jgi:predicted DNA-binding protein with PD1-like motif